MTLWGLIRSLLERPDPPAPLAAPAALAPSAVRTCERFYRLNELVYDARAREFRWVPRPVLAKSGVFRTGPKDAVAPRERWPGGPEP